MYRPWRWRTRSSAIGESVVAGSADPLALELLYRRPPKSRVATGLHETVLAIQGPPGTGKTYTGGTMICDLVQAGKKVGVVATGHKVIRNLLDAVSKEAVKRGIDCEARPQGRQGRGGRG